MSGKVTWTGLTMIVAFPLIPVPGGDIWPVVGAIFMIFGVGLMWLDR